MDGLDDDEEFFALPVKASKHSISLTKSLHKPPLPSKSLPFSNSVSTPVHAGRHSKPISIATEPVYLNSLIPTNLNSSIESTPLSSVDTNALPFTSRNFENEFSIPFHGKSMYASDKISKLLCTGNLHIY